MCVFRADRKNKMAAMASDWLRHFRLLFWNCGTEFNETWQEARSQRPLPSVCFSGRSEKQDGHPGLWLAELFSTSALKLLDGIRVFFGPIEKIRRSHPPLICWDIFDFSSETAERAAVAEWLSSWLVEQEDRGSIPRLATLISEIGYLLLPSRDERSLNRR